jgi:two-component system sensor histidine kinase KdpD
MAYAETVLSQASQMSPEEQESCMKGIVRSLGRLNRLVRNILSSSRLSSEPINLDWQKVKLRKVIGSLAREYRNLYGALKYSPADTTVTVGARHLAALDWNRDSGVSAELTPCVLVWVHNQANGYIPVDLENLFERFRRGNDQSITSGTGLGLYVCHSIVGAHGGKIWGNGDSQKGITFTFCLPLAGAPRQLQFKEMSLPGQ